MILFHEKLFKHVGINTIYRIGKAFSFRIFFGAVLVLLRRESGLKKTTNTCISKSELHLDHIYIYVKVHSRI